MKKICLILCVLSFSISSIVNADAAYLEKFQAYLDWSQNLPDNAEPALIEFIETNTPLAKKLRQKWLYHLADNENWPVFVHHYQPSEAISLQCLAFTAFYKQGQTSKALEGAETLWLVGYSQPSECDALFKLLLSNHSEREHLITKRIVLALEKRNLSLARFLLKQYSTPRHEEIKTLNDIYRTPARIRQLNTGELHDDYYLYGLKRMVSLNMPQAIRYWKHVKTKKLLNEKQQQAFLAHVALYKAMRNHKDAPIWFAKVKPEFYTDVLLDWQIRFALKRHRWHEVARLIQLTGNTNDLTWQYWLARAMEAQGKKSKARAIYEQLAKNRNYYGFLASRKLHQTFSFENEAAISDLTVLEPYKPFTDQVKALYNTNQSLKASRLLNDFVLELPSNEQSALAYWLATELHWYGKALYLINSRDELNNQLSLRFPLAYHHIIKRHANHQNLSDIFIFSIIRQESTFREDVVSSAGAHGLMQVMPATAKHMAKRENVPLKHKEELFIPDKNIHLGSAYLAYLAKRFNKHPLLMAAAYNAGPKQVHYWLKHHPPKQIDLWIETLPWHETRNYLKNVIAFYAVYQYRLHQTPNLNSFFKPL